MSGCRSRRQALRKHHRRPAASHQSAAVRSIGAAVRVGALCGGISDANLDDRPEAVSAMANLNIPQKVTLVQLTVSCNQPLEIDIDTHRCSSCARPERLNRRPLRDGRNMPLRGTAVAPGIRAIDTTRHGDKSAYRQQVIPFHSRQPIRPSRLTRSQRIRARYRDRCWRKAPSCQRLRSLPSPSSRCRSTVNARQCVAICCFGSNRISQPEGDIEIPSAGSRCANSACRRCRWRLYREYWRGDQPAPRSIILHEWSCAFIELLAAVRRAASSIPRIACEHQSIRPARATSWRSPFASQMQIR